MNIAALIQNQLLQTLFQALAASDQPLKAGDKVQAAFIGWADDAADPSSSPATARVQIGAQTVNLLLGADAARRAALQPGAGLTLIVDKPAKGAEPAQVRLMAITAGAGQGAPLASAPENLATPRQLQVAAPPSQGSAGALRLAAGPVAGAALATQDSFAPLFANLQALVLARAALPSPVLDAALRVLNLRLDVADGNVAPEALRKAVNTSGVFHEARLAQGQPGEAAVDLKSALLVLRQALSEGLRGTQDSGPEAMPLPKGAPAREDDAPATPMRAEQQAQASSQARAAAPLREGLPVPQGIVAASIDPATQSVSTMLAKVLESSESALDRLTLGQYASLPNAVDAAQGAPLNRWHVELPMMLDGRTAVLPLEIEEDRGGGTASASRAKLWRVRFALDAEPMGPVHALVTMQGKVIGVSVWAERDATSQLVRDFAPDLEAALLDSDFERADIDVIAGQPMRRAAHAGHYLDRRS